ncbi:hypothetical protein [Curtobacterium luteum]|uniref:hypothetical protein n=1 Tax=Curtobacterium luteum TaxID=33881 RepID=UPI003803D85E
MHAERQHSPRTTVMDTTAEFNAFGGTLIRRVPSGPYETAGFAWEGGSRAGGITTGTTLYYDSRRSDGVARHSVTDSREPDLVTTVHDALSNIGGDEGTRPSRADVSESLDHAAWEQLTVTVDDEPTGARRAAIGELAIVMAQHAGHTFIAIGDLSFVTGPYETLKALPAVSLGQRQA